MKVEEKRRDLIRQEVILNPIDESEELEEIKKEAEIADSPGYKKRRIFLSYCHRDSDIADLIEERLLPHISRNFTISRDVRDVKYKGSFRKFMQAIREHEYVLMILSDRYMKSLNCMYEMLEVFKDSNYGKKLLFLVISDADRQYLKESTDESIAADIYTTEGRTKYMLFWKEEQRKISEQIERIGEPMYAQMQIEEKYRIEKIKLELTEFFNYISDANGLTLGKHLETDFEELLKMLE